MGQFFPFAVITPVLASQPAGQTPSLRIVVRRAARCFAGMVAVALAAPFAPQLDAQTIAGVANAATADSRLSPGVLAAIYGTNLGATAATPVTIGGRAVAVLFASPGQFGVQLPFDTPPGSTSIQVGSSPPFAVTVAAFAPGLFAVNSAGSGTATALKASGTAVSSANPVAAGETISLFATGLGPVSPAVPAGTRSPVSPVSNTVERPAVTVGGVAVTVQGSFLQPGQVGVYQVNIVIPAGLANGNQPVVLTVSGAASNTVTLPLGPPGADPAPSIAAAVSATGIPGSVQFNIQSGSWVAIYGANLSDVTTDWTGQIVNGALPISLAGVSVTINGRAAFVYYVSPTQVNVQAPDAPPGAVQVVVTRRGVSSPPATAQLRQHAPAFFHWGAAKYALTTRYPDNTYVGHPDLGAVFVAARPGNVLILWGTGFGPTVPQAPAGAVVSGAPVTATLPTVTVGGLPATVIGAALSPGLAGVYQVAIQLPDNVPAGDVEVRATIGGQQSPENVYLYVRRD